MIPFLLAFAYPGECARLMLAHPGIEIYAPVVAVFSLALVWFLVWVLFRSKLAAIVSVVVLAFIPSFRLGFMHPLKSNFVLLVALLVITAVIFVCRMRWGKRIRDEVEKHALAKRLASIGLSLFAVASLAIIESIPVYVATVAAVMAGVALSHWWETRKTSLLPKIMFGVLSLVFALSCGLQLFFGDWCAGEFADRMAAAIIADMGDRDWIVTDGVLDDHLQLVAQSMNRKIHIVSLVRDDDAAYRKSLANLVRSEKLAGDASEELALSLDLGILQFVQDWFRADPEIAKKCVVFGAPDLWYSAGLTPVPEMLFFGGDPKRVADWSRWPQFDEMLHAPRNWGSYQPVKGATHVDHLRLGLRRHLGLVANDRGVWLQESKQDDQAFALYRLVVDDIDRDNVSAIINLIVMANGKYAPAVAIEKDLEARMDKIVKDKNRRYLLGSLARFYGYVRDPQLFVRLGFLWARSGMPETAMAQIRRAIDLVPSDRRRTLVNMLAALYADSNDRAKSRQVYERVLADNSEDHEALIGMVRLSLLDGDQAQALAYLERATAVGGDDPRIDIEKAMVAVMKNDLVAATEILKRCADADAKDPRAISLLAAVTMQRCELEKDEAKRKALEADLEKKLLPALEKRVSSDNYYLNTVRAFALLRKGNDEKRRREARDAFAAAVRARPDIAANRDIVLGLDISLGDQTNAAFHARETLKANRKSPIANYVMGSLALEKDDLKTAEMYLKRAVECDKPVDLALNDLAEVYRRLGRPADGLVYAEKAVTQSPKLYIARATLAAIFMDLNRDLPRALTLMNEALELSRVDGRAADFRMYLGLARAQFMNGDAKSATTSLRKMKSHVGDLDRYDKREYEELLKRVK